MSFISSNRKSFYAEGFIRRFAIIVLFVTLIVFFILPLGELFKLCLFETVTISLESGETIEESTFVGLKFLREYFSQESLSSSLYNSLYVATVSALFSVLCAFIYAYAIKRRCIPMKGLFRIIALCPLFCPTMLYGLSLVYLFGRKGLVTTGFFGTFEGININLYGSTGIIISEFIYSFPATFLILFVALENSDARLYETARTMQAGSIRQFFTITLPSLKLAIMNAFLVAFMLAFTDFGAPKIVGGQYNILAVDIYKQVVGQQNFSMGATVCIILMVPMLIAFFADRFIQKKQSSILSARAVLLHPKKHFPSDTIFFILCIFIATVILLVIGTGCYASFVTSWPYNLKLSLKHFDFSNVSGGSMAAIINSLKMSFFTAFFGTAITFLAAYLLIKSKCLSRIRQISNAIVLFPLALPGLVFGIAYVFFFNRPDFTLPLLGEIQNPFNALYGTLWILVVVNIVHFFTVSFTMAKTALNQLDKEFESVAESMSIPFWTTLRSVIVPVCMPSIIEIASYLFVSTMATVSAVMFLYSPDTRPATIAIVNMDDAGDQEAAAAMCFLIVIINVFVRVTFDFLSSRLKQKTERWRQK